MRHATLPTFVGPGTDCSPCRRTRPAPCNGVMSISQLPTETTPQLGRYTVDPAASSITFRTRHMFGIAPVRGHFSIRAGVVDVNEPIAESSVQIEADAATFRTLNPMRDGVVRSVKFLDVERFPLIVFVSTGLAGTALAGELTAHGVTRPVTFEIKPGSVDVASDSFTAKAAARIDRTEFGVTGSPGMAGRYLNVVVKVRCVKR